MRPAGTPQELERRRFAALALLDRGLMPHQVARRLGVDRRSVRRWRSAARRRGPSALRARPAPGRPTRLSVVALRRLRRLLLKGAAACGFSSDLWTSVRVGQVVRREFGVAYHRDHICRVLHRLGFSPQRPVRQPLERDEGQIRHWLGQTWVAVKKTGDA